MPSFPQYAFMAWCSVKKNTGTTLPLLDGAELSASRPGRFTLRERAPITHWIGG